MVGLPLGSLVLWFFGSCLLASTVALNVLESRVAPPPRSRNHASRARLVLWFFGSLFWFFGSLVL
eukprot:COSAG06_NODE_68170_length_237_cov_9.753623_1_plen_64_part_01